MSEGIGKRIQRRLHWPKDHFVKRSLRLLQNQFNSDFIAPSEEETEEEIEKKNKRQWRSELVKKANQASSRGTRSFLTINLDSQSKSRDPHWWKRAKDIEVAKKREQVSMGATMVHCEGTTTNCHIIPGIFNLW